MVELACGRGKGFELVLNTDAASDGSTTTDAVVDVQFVVIWSGSPPGVPIGPPDTPGFGIGVVLNLLASTCGVGLLPVLGGGTPERSAVGFAPSPDIRAVRRSTMFANVGLSNGLAFQHSCIMLVRTGFMLP